MFLPQINVSPSNRYFSLSLSFLFFLKSINICSAEDLNKQKKPNSDIKFLSYICIRDRLLID